MLVESFFIVVAGDSWVGKGGDSSSDFKGSSSLILDWMYDIICYLPCVSMIELTPLSSMSWYSCL
jgi:hypothetical protein